MLISYYLSRYSVFRFTIILIIFLVPLSIPIVSAYSNENSTCYNVCCCNEPDTIESLLKNPTVIAAIITGISTVIAGWGGKEIVVNHIRMRNVYFIPYTEWCIKFSGTLHEFRELWEDMDRNNYSSKDMDHTTSDIITHIWEIHKEVESGYRWLSMVKKIDTDIGDRLDYIMDIIDRLWHKLETEHHDVILRVDGAKDIKEIIYHLGRNEKDSDNNNRTELVTLTTIAQKICNFLKNENTKFPKDDYKLLRGRILQEDNFEDVKRILNENVPRSYTKSHKTLIITIGIPTALLAIFILSLYYLLS